MLYFDEVETELVARNRIVLPNIIEGKYVEKDDNKWDINEPEPYARFLKESMDTKKVPIHLKIQLFRPKS
jgi:hypothetical protein